MANSLYLVENPNRRVVPASDLLVMAGRTERYRWELLSLTGDVVSGLDGVTDGQLEFSNQSTLRSSGSMTYEGPGGIDWLTVLVRATYEATFPEGSTMSWPLGVYVPAAPETAYDDGTSTLDIELQSLLQILDEDELEQTFALPAGTVVTPAIRALIAGAGTVGGARVAGTDSDEALRSALVWEPGTSRLRIINDLLAAINYFSLWVDALGTFRLDPYVPPVQRGVAWDFVDSAIGITAPGFRHTRDLFAVPNKVTGVAQGSSDAPALVGVAINDDITSPFSINMPDPATGVQGRGRVISKTETNIEATSQQVLDGIVERRLAELSQVASSVDISHWMVPLVPNDVVTFRRETGGLDLRGVVQKTSIQCVPGALAQTTIREVTG